MGIAISNPAYLWFLLIIPLIIISHFFSLKLARGKAIKFANFSALSRVSDERRIPRNWNLLFLRIAVVFLIIFSISSPVLWYSGVSSDLESIIAIDASGSMLAEDFSPNRLEAAKYSASLFIESVPANAKVGVVSFSGNAFVEQPLTDDKIIAMDKTKLIDARYSSGTAIGDAIITSANLFNYEAKTSKVIILLTDGQNTAGTLIQEATDYVKEKGITVFTLGVGTKEGAEFGALEALSKLDEDTLEDIAKKTGGSYYFSGEKEQLINAFKEITSEHKKKIPLRLSSLLMISALILLMIEWGVLNTIYKRAP